jgi:parallel beta-helix repeat protein
MDSGGLISFAFAWVVVSISADGVIVTTAEDEDDPVSDLSNPGGTGLSLREAIRYVNDQGGSKTISFAGPMTIDTGANGPLPAVTSNAVQVVGLPGVTIDFAGTGAEGTCFMLEGANGMAINLDLARCAGTAIEIGGNSNQVLGCTLRKGEGTASVGARLTGTGAVFGPENEVWGWGAGVEMKSTANLVDGNRIRGNNTGIFVDSGRGGIVQRNAIFANTGAGVALASREQEAQIRHNTIDGNQGDGLNAPGNAEDLEVCNNLFTHNAGHGISGPGHAFVGRDPNGFFDNLQGNFSSGTPDSSSVVADPLYTDRAAGDFRLKEGSLAIDKGIDDGVDMNGARASNYNGEAPDLGGFESL